MRSLTARLSGNLIIALLILTMLLLVGMHYSLRHLGVTFISARLEHDVDNLLAGLNLDPGFHLSVNDSRLARYFQQPLSGHYYQIRFRDQVLRSRSLWDNALWENALSHDEPAFRTTNDTAELQVFFLNGPNDQHLLSLHRLIKLRGQTVSILVAEDFTPVNTELKRLQVEFALLLMIVLVTLLLIQYAIVQRGLRPLRTIRHDIQRLASGQIRQLDPEAPVEIQPLVGELNRLLNVIEQRLQRSRHAMGNLAHALKTPLAILTQIADQAPQDQQHELRQQTGQITRLIERELKRARIAGAAPPGQQAQIFEVVQDLVTTLEKIYRDKQLQIDYQVPQDSYFPVDRNDLMELLGNLLDNACQWATQRIRLRAALTTHELSLSIEDDGPGCDPEQLQVLTQRGARLDETGPGSGLGLAIASEIVRQYQGSFKLDRSPELNGLRVSFVLRNELTNNP